MADVQPESIKWLWTNRIALGKFALLDGDPDVGKSLITIDLAARVSTGRPMPLDTSPPGDTGTALFLCCEDSAKDTIGPRLAAAEAQMRRVELITTLLSLPEQIETLEGHVRETGAKLLIIDPLTAYLSGKINTNSDREVRTALMPLAQLAERMGIAIVGVRHFNKQPGMRALHRGGGSVAFIGVARTAFAVGRDPDDDTTHIMAPIKGNVVARGECAALRYRIVATEQKQPRIEWIGPCDVSADQLSAPPDSAEQAGMLRDAIEWLHEQLAEGPRQAGELYKQAEEAEIAQRTLRRARVALRAGSGRIWQLPTLRTNPATAAGGR